MNSNVRREKINLPPIRKPSNKPSTSYQKVSNPDSVPNQSKTPSEVQIIPEDDPKPIQEEPKHKLYLYKGLHRSTTLKYRLVFLFIALVSLTREVIYFIQRKRMDHFVVLLTQHSLILLNITLIVGVVHAWKDRPYNPNSKLTKIYGILHTTTLTAETLVCLFYWGIISWFHIPAINEFCTDPLVCHTFNLLTHLYPIIPTWIVLFIEPTFIQKTQFKWFMFYLLL